jgi:signal transduction histidine kinase
MTSRVVTAPTGMHTSPAIDALWLAMLQRICGRAAHEIKGVLNGVSINLEVVRSRSAKPDAPASSVAPYANAAAQQFDLVIDMTEALLALSRAPSGGADVGVTVRRLRALLAPVAAADGKSLELGSAVDELGTSSADSSAVRLAIGAALSVAIESASEVRCAAADGVLRVEISDGGVLLPLDEEIVSAARRANIEIRAEPSAISISFPR